MTVVQTEEILVEELRADPVISAGRLPRGARAPGMYVEDSTYFADPVTQRARLCFLTITGLKRMGPVDALDRKAGSAQQGERGATGDSGEAKLFLGVMG